jgi:hypothetical protein
MHFKMVYNKLFATTIIITLLGINSFAQQSKKPAKPVTLSKEQISSMKKDAAEYYKSENYKSALGIYKSLQASEPENTEFNYRLGVCYLNTFVSRKSAAGFLVKAASAKDAPKDVNLYLGRALLILEEIDDAADTYEKYKIDNHGKVNPKVNFENQVEWCYHARDLKKAPIQVSFSNLGKLVNSPNNDYRPVCNLMGDIIYFTSNRKGNTGAIVDGYGEMISDGYFTMKDTGYSKAKNLGPNINDMYYDEPLHINASGDRLLTYKEGGSASSPLYIAELNGKTFNKAVPIQKFPAGKIEGACMTSDGKTIYFSADLKGGKGGKDIWMTTQNDKGEWSAPKNLGDGVNTKYDEVNPWLFFDDQTLFFASEGHNSMGGFDIFMSTQPHSSMEWSNAVNLGYPLNNTDDNKFFCLTADGKTGYIAAANENGVGELDLIKFTTAKPIVLQNRVVTKISLQKQDGTPARDALCLLVKNDTGENFGLFNANSNTGIMIAYLPPGNYKLKVKGVKSGRLDEDFTITGNEKDFQYIRTIKLNPPVKEGK